MKPLSHARKSSNRHLDSQFDPAKDGSVAFVELLSSGSFTLLKSLLSRTASEAVKSPGIDVRCNSLGTRAVSVFKLTSDATTVTTIATTVGFTLMINSLTHCVAVHLGCEESCKQLTKLMESDDHSRLRMVHNHMNMHLSAE